MTVRQKLASLGGSAALLGGGFAVGDAMSASAPTGGGCDKYVITHPGIPAYWVQTIDLPDDPQVCQLNVGDPFIDSLRPDQIISHGDFIHGDHDGHP